MKKLLLTLLSAISGLLLVAQNATSVVTPPLSLNIKRTAVEMRIDGELDEAVWQESMTDTEFWQHFPADTLSAIGQTEIMMTYDEQYLYVAVRCFTQGGDYVIPSLKRDYSFPGNDNITLLFDTYNDQTNAFVFGLNPYGVQREALVSNGGRQFDDFASSWDNKWFGEAARYDDYWTAEFAIPFKTLRYKEGGTEWRFNCYRSDTQYNEWSTWNRIPRNYLIMDLAYMGRILWDEPLRKPGANVSLIPYVTAGVTRDYESVGEQKADWQSDIGGDAKIALSSSLNLDLTVNPDFSQVEVDAQVTNLDRFEIFFPERRQFFLENADLFGTFGLSRVNPFFSRRIGVAIDTATGVNVQNPIYYGARLSGKLSDRFRVGLLNMQTAPLKQSGLPSFNYTVAALQQQVFSRSNVSFIFVNKEAINESDYQGDFQPYNRVAGLEYRLASADNRWTGKTFYHRAFTPQPKDHNFTHGLQIEHLQRRYRMEWAHVIVGNGFDAEVGFVPRRDYMLLSPEVGVFFFPSEGIFNQHSLNVDTRFFFQIGKDGNEIVADYTMTERQTELQWDFQFVNNTRGGLTLLETELTLLQDFDPTRRQAAGVVLPAGSSYHFFNLEGEYTSDQRKGAFWSIAPNIGQFFNGFRAGLAGSLTIRYQPYGSVTLSANYNYIALDAPFEPTNIWLVGPRIDLTFSKKVFLTTFIQYNNQSNNLNINTRFQWRFQPVSDFFLVYTDNYVTDPLRPFSVRNRALVAKVTYWLNL